MTNDTVKWWLPKTFTATFADGTVKTREGFRAYTHAWRSTFPAIPGSFWQITENSGFSESKEKAESNGTANGYLQNCKVEVVEVTVECSEGAIMS